MDKSNELVAKIILPKPILSISGKKLSGLPPTIVEAMKSSKTTALGMDREEIKSVVPTEWVIFGAQRLRITVKKHDMSEKKRPSKRIPPPSPGPPPPGMGDHPANPYGGEEMDYENYLLSGFSTPGMIELAAAPNDVEKPENGKPKNGAPAPKDKTAAKKGAKKASADKPIGRMPTVWNHTSRTDFLKGDMKNVSSCTEDNLLLSASLEPFKELNDTYIWCLLPDGSGSVYTGTGNKGVIYKIAPDGAESVLFDSPELEVHCLAKDSMGNIYAGTSPNGIIYKIDPAGKAETLFDAGEKYILALVVDGKDNLYASTGDKGRVYKIGPDGKVKIALDSPENSVLSLAVDKDDNIYAGTGQSGLIYKISPSGAASVLYDSDQAAITALAVTKDGTLYAGSSPKGVIYKLTPGVSPKVVYDKAKKSITSITVDESGDVYAASLVEIYRIMPDDSICAIQNKKDLQFLSLTSHDGVLYAGTGNIGSIWRANIGNITEGVYESPIHDCKLPSSWGVIRWTADTPKGASIMLQTRMGDTPEPDATWSGWSPVYTSSEARIVGSPARYIQYKATLTSEDPSVSPKLKDVSIVYLPKNQQPKVALVNPKGGDSWSGKKDVRWKGKDPDKDSLSYQVFYSSDGGAKWTLLDNGMKTAEPNSEEPEESDEEIPEDLGEDIPPFEQKDVMAEVEAELDKHPDIPPEMREQILAEAEAMSQAGDMVPPSAPPTSSPNKNGTKRTKQSWDTTKMKDGEYIIKVVASDKSSNPVGALTKEDISEAFTVCNTPPTVNVFDETITVGGDNSASAEGFASHEMVAVVGVQFRVDGGDWAAAAASDGIFDTGSEPFIITTEVLTKGDHKIDVKAIDEAGNTTETKFTVTVP